MTHGCYYNEIDPFAADWLENLIRAGLIAPGDVDRRSIVDVRPDDLRGYVQCHWFAGIGGWSYALRLAGWPDDRPVWTGSCPCQPFSAAGAGKAADDERHLWPTWFPLIAECQPPVVLGEQVDDAIGWGWLDLVFSDLEAEGYACGASVLPACSIGAPHIRDRVWFVANADGGNASTEGLQRSGQHGLWSEDSRVGGRVALATGQQRNRRRNSWSGRREPADSGGMVNAEGKQEGIPGRAWEPGNAFWADAEFIPCADGKARPIEPGSFPLAHGISRRASKLRAYGNAIVPQVAAAFIQAAEEAVTPATHLQEER